jgi:PAS domain S-box-containing protein
LWPVLAIPQFEGTPMLPFDKLAQPIWEASPHPIAVVSFEAEPRERRFVYCNPAFTVLTGYASSEVLGGPATLLDGSKTSHELIEERESRIRQGKAHDATFVHYRKDGSEYLAHATIARLVEPDGSADFLIWFETIVLPLEKPRSDESVDANQIVVPLTLPMPLKEFPAGVLPRHLTTHPDLEALKALWNRVRGDRPMPHRRELDLKTVAQWAGHLSIVTVTSDARFQFRLFGSDLAAVYGWDLTGRFLDELTPKDLWSVVILHYEDVVKTRMPLFAPISIANGRWYSEVSRLLLPLSDGTGDEVAYVMAADYKRVAY